MPIKTRAVRKKTCGFFCVIIIPRKAITIRAKTGPLLAIRIINRAPENKQMAQKNFPQSFSTWLNNIIGPMDNKISKEPAGIGFEENNKILLPGELICWITSKAPLPKRIIKQNEHK